MGFQAGIVVSFLSAPSETYMTGYLIKVLECVQVEQPVCIFQKKEGAHWDTL